MNEVVVNEQKKSKAKNPFVRLDKCQAIINDLDYDSNGRLTYMPYNGVYCEPGATNKVISTPDSYSVALTYTDWCVKIINSKLFNFAEDIKRGFIDSALSNIDYILTDRLKFETANAIHTIFSTGTKALMDPYIINQETASKNYQCMYLEIMSLHFGNMFFKDSYDNNNRNNSNYYALEPDDVAIKTSRIISFAAADISHMFSSYIYREMSNLDISRFVSDQIASIDLDRSIVSPDTDYPYATSVLNESAHNDLIRIIELVEMLVNHAFYIFCQYYKNFSSNSPKMLEVKKDPDHNINIYKKPCRVVYNEIPF